MKTVSPVCLLLCLSAASWCGYSANAQAPANPTPDTPAPFELPNGDMTQGEGLPTGWKPPAVRAIKATRDTVVFRSAPASLCVTGSNSNPPQPGTASLVIRNGDVKNFTLSGYIGSEAGVNRSLMIQYKSEDDADIIVSPIDLPPHQDQWLAFSRNVNLPPYVTEFTLSYGVMGAGSAWLDDLKVSAPAAPAPPAQR